MNTQPKIIDNISQYNHLLLYAEHINGTSVIYNGDDVYNYFYNKIAMDIYVKQQSSIDAIVMKNAQIIKRLLYWVVFYFFCRMIFNFVKRIVCVSKNTKVRVIVSKNYECNDFSVEFVK
jgi:hypothetical protein